MKIAVIGGGSTYSPELAAGLLGASASIPLDELWLMDTDQPRLAIVGGFIRRLVRRQGDRFKVVLTSSQPQAVAGASYVINQVRVGQMAARRADEYLGQRHGLIGQETTGVGGMAKALRTIPAALQIARDVRRLSPSALLINFANPAGLITEALTRQLPEVTSVGLCNIALTTSQRLLALINPVGALDRSLQQGQIDTLGLNHLTWFRGLSVEDQDYWPQILPLALENARADPETQWMAPVIEALGLIPNPYLGYFLETGHRLAAQNTWPPSRAEQVMLIEKQLLEFFANPEHNTIPQLVSQRGGAHYATLALLLIDSHHHNRGHHIVVNRPQQGAVEGWPDDWVLELPCRVDAAGFHPLPARPLPAPCADLVARVKEYELQTVRAAVDGDRRAARQALLAHPLGPHPDQVDAVLDDLLATNQSYLPAFDF